MKAFDQSVLIRENTLRERERARERERERKRESEQRPGVGFCEVVENLSRDRVAFSGW